jgi:hypothetical protein
VAGVGGGSIPSATETDAANFTLHAASPPAATPLSPGAVDAPISTYAQQQAVRDGYRDRIDELTFNDELGDGVSLAQALVDAMAAHIAPQKGHLP